MSDKNRFFAQFSSAGSGGGGGSTDTLYSADGTIGTGRVAIVTDTLAFRHPTGAIYGSFNFDFTTTDFPSFKYGGNQIVTVYRANQTYAFGKLGDTTNNFQFNTGVNPNYSSADTVFISGGATHTNTLHVKGGGSTTATSSLFIENSSAETLFSILDDGSSGIGISPTYNLGSGITSLEISDTTSGGVVLRNDADTQTSYWYNHGTGTYFGTSTNNKLNFIQNSIVRMNLDVNGGLSIGQTTTEANASSLLDLVSTTKGFLPPRMTTTERDLINSGTFADGLVVYNTTTNKLQYYNGTAWSDASGGNTIYNADDSITASTDRVVTVPVSSTLRFGTSYVGVGDAMGFTSRFGVVHDTGMEIKSASGGYGNSKLVPYSPGGIAHYNVYHRWYSSTGTQVGLGVVAGTILLDSGGAVATKVSIGTTTHSETLRVKGFGSTNATSSLLIENSSGTELLKMLDSAEATINNAVASPLNALTLENETGGANHSVCGVKLQLTNNGDTGYIGQFDSVGGGTGAPTMIIESPTGMHYIAGANYVNGYHYFKTDNAVGFGIGRDTNSAILRSILAGGGGNYTELQLAYTGGDYNFIKTHATTGGKFIFGRENGGATEYMRIAEDGEVLIGTPTTDASAILNVTSTTQGFLPPRMTTTEMNAISSVATGLMVYDTTTNQWMGYDGTSWVILG